MFEVREICTEIKNVKNIIVTYVRISGGTTQFQVRAISCHLTSQHTLHFTKIQGHTDWIIVVCFIHHTLYVLSIPGGHMERDIFIFPRVTLYSTGLCVSSFY